MDCWRLALREEFARKIYYFFADLWMFRKMMAASWFWGRRFFGRQFAQRQTPSTAVWLGVFRSWTDLRWLQRQKPIKIRCLLRCEKSQGCKEEMMLTRGYFGDAALFSPFGWTKAVGGLSCWSREISRWPMRFEGSAAERFVAHCSPGRVSIGSLLVVSSTPSSGLFLI